MDTPKRGRDQEEWDDLEFSPEDIALLERLETEAFSNRRREKIECPEFVFPVKGTYMMLSDEQANQVRCF